MFSSSSKVISVPSPSSSKLESTRSRTRYLPANSTERICSTLEPRLASSSISSNVTVLQPPRVGNDARVGGVDAVDVRVNLTFVGFQRGRERNARRIGAAAAERGDISGFVDTLESGDDDHAPRRRGRRVYFLRRSTGCAPWCARCR